MDISATIGTVSASELLCDMHVEQSVEGEFTVPDYQPPIWKIVKTKAEPVVTSRLCVGSRATVEGYVKVTVLYCTDTEDRLYSLVHRLPFSKQLELREGVGERWDMMCGASLAYLNCRAVNQRRIDVRGAVQLAVRLLSHTAKEVLAAAEGAGVQTLAGEIAFAEKRAGEQRQFTLDERLELGADAKDAAVIRTDAVATVGDCILENGRARVLGTVHVTVATDQSGEEGLLVRRWGYMLPFEQIVEVDGDLEGCEAYARVVPVSCSASADSGRQGVLDASVSCELSLSVLRPVTAPVLEDAFSTKCETAVARESLSLCAARHRLHIPFTFKGTLEKKGEAVDWFLSGCEVAAAEEGLRLTGTVCVISALNGVLSAEESPFSMPLPLDVPVTGNTLLSAFMAVPDLACHDSGNTRTLRGEGFVEGDLWDMVKKDAVRSVKAEENKPRPAAETPLCVYYAEAGERVWTIARTFGAAPDRIAAQNGLEEGILPADMPLLIPLAE